MNDWMTAIATLAAAMLYLWAALAPLRRQDEDYPGRTGNPTLTLLLGAGGLAFVVLTINVGLNGLGGLGVAAIEFAVAYLATLEIPRRIEARRLRNEQSARKAQADKIALDEAFNKIIREGGASGLAG